MSSPLEHTVHVATWKIAPALSWVHGRAQAGGVEPSTASRGRTRPRSRSAAGVLNTVHGLGESAGKALTEHPLIRAIAFVGESATGSLIQAQGAPTLKRVHFELGGKNPVIVFDEPISNGSRRGCVHDLVAQR